MPEINIDYIECDGVRVPSTWTGAQLKEALAKRKIRFQNEAAIMHVFGNAIHLKATLEQKVLDLQAEVAKWDQYVKEKKALAACPKCQTQWTEPPAIKNTRESNKPISKAGRGIDRIAEGKCPDCGGGNYSKGLAAVVR